MGQLEFLEVLNPLSSCSAGRRLLTSLIHASLSLALIVDREHLIPVKCEDHWPESCWKLLPFFLSASQDVSCTVTPCCLVSNHNRSWSRISRSNLLIRLPSFSPGPDRCLWRRLQVGCLCSARMMTEAVLLRRSARWETRNTNPAEASPCWAPNGLAYVPFHQQLACLPERGPEDLSRRALFGVVVVAVEEVSKHSLVSRDVHGLQTVHALCAGLRQRQTRPPVWTPLVVLNAPKMTRFMPEN